MSLLDEAEPFTPAEVAQIKSGAPSWVNTTPEGGDVVVVTRQFVREQIARYPSMVPGFVQPPATPLAPTLTNRYPRTWPTGQR